MTSGLAFQDTGPNRRALLDRGVELEQLERALRAAADGEGGLVVVEGPAGIGKSALLAAARAQARTRGERVLRARGAELERDFAFGVARQLFEPVLAASSADERAQLMQGPAARAAAQLGLPGVQEDQPERGAAGADASFAALHGLYWLCANLAARGPLCLLIDDAHWADAPSLRFATFLAGRLEELPVVLVIATRSGEGAPDAAALMAALMTSAADVVRPRSLTSAGIASMLASEFDVAPAPEFVAACHEATGGTPFLVRELIAALHADAVAPEAASAPAVAQLATGSVARWILLRLGRLPEPAARLARAVAILERCSLSHAAAIADLGIDDAAHAADLLETASVLRRGRPLEFVHPLVRAAVYGEVPSAEREAGHRRAAELLATEHGDDERAVEHLLAIEPAGDPWVVERLSAAARFATRAGAPESAAAYLQRALAEPPPPEQRAQLLLESAVAQDSAGQPGVHARLEASIAAATSNDDRVKAALLLGHVLARDQRSPAALAALDSAAASLRPPDEALAARLEIAAVATGMIDADTASAVDRRALALRRGADEEAAPPRELLAIAAFVAAQRNEPAAVVGDLARRALTAGEGALPSPEDMPWFPVLLGALLWAEHDREAESLVDAATAHALAAADPALLCVALMHRSYLGLRRGDLAGVESAARTLLDDLGQSAPLMYTMYTSAFLAEALVIKGDLAEAERVLADRGAGMTGRTQAAASLLLARGRLRLAQLRADDGAADLLAAGALITRTRIRGPGFLLWRSDAGQALALLGDDQRGKRLIEEEVALARAFGAPRALGMALRVAGAVEGGRRGEDLLREAAGLLEGRHARLEHARALTELGALLRRTNRRAESREPLRLALDLAHRAGAEPLATRAETELRATGAKPRRVVLSGLDSLTPSERRIARLAADGLTNREIAQTLFVTARTVETHLTHVFAKLEVDSRTALPAALEAP